MVNKYIEITGRGELGDDTPYKPGSAIATERAAGPELGAAEPASKGRVHRRIILQFASLLYSVFFFVQPYRRNAAREWFWFALFYLAFLVFYFSIPKLRGRVQIFFLASFFLLGFVYYPFNSGAAGIFVYAVVLVAIVLPNTRIFLAVLAGQIASILLETWAFHLSFGGAETCIFFTVVIGLSNLAYFQEQRANLLLQQANEEIASLTQEAERQRIARDLHDVLGHTLTVITVKLNVARQLLEVDLARARNEIVDAEDTARRALAEVRETVTGYRSEGLAAEIACTRQTLLSAEVDFTVALDPCPMSSAQVEVLCLVLRESVTNIVRHAHATACHLELSRAEQGLRFVVTDNGVGGEPQEGNGLKGMRDRVARLGGTMSLAATKGSGVQLVVTLPHEKGKTSQGQNSFINESDVESFKTSSSQQNALR